MILYNEHLPFACHLFCEMRPSIHRHVIVQLSQEGKTVKEIASIVKMRATSVRRICQRFKERGHVKAIPKSERPRSVNTSELRKKIKKKVQRKSHRSMRHMAKEYGISEGTMRNIVKNDLKLFPYRIRKAHLLNASMMQTRLERARSLLAWAAKSSFARVIFSDEKIFTVERSHNSQNTRQLLPKGSRTSANAEFTGRSNFPQSVIVWAGVCSMGKTPLIFIDKGIKVNSVIYVNDIIKGSLLPWAKSHFNRRPWTFQQDWAPAHGSKFTLDSMRQQKIDFLGKDLWPPYSPDLNPLDFSIWSILEQRACATTHTNINTLKSALRKAWNGITSEELAACVTNFQKRLKACIRARGGHFESFL